ncbi:MAG: AbrB/MazE/SpoVT family DNA-binding domain-containing protein [Desulfurococcales archaeon]|jgi:antitoxin MazE
MDRFVLKVGKKGVVILPKRLRAEAGIEEESLILAEVRDNNIILRPLKPVTVSIDWAVVEKLLAEEREDEEEKVLELLKQLRS